MTKETFGTLVGDFCWCWSSTFFIETSEGNFIWEDPDYNGDNTIKPFDGSFKVFLNCIGLDFGRDKGKHIISEYLGGCWDSAVFLDK